MTHRFQIPGRARQAIVAGLIAFVLFLINFVGPLDQFLWTNQYRLASFEASGSIVFVGDDQNLADPDFPQRREELARALDKIREAGARRVYIDMVFEQPSNPAADTRLDAAIHALGDKAYLVQKYESDVNGQRVPNKSMEMLSSGVSQVAEHHYMNYLRRMWEVRWSMAEYGGNYPPLPVSMAEVEPSGKEATFPINYSFSLASIPSLELRNVAAASPSQLASLRNKTVILGQEGDSADLIDIPGHTQVPSSIVHIYSAETLKAGLTGRLSPLVLAAAYLLILLPCAFISNSRIRRCMYGAAVLSIPALFLASAHLGVRISAATALALFLLYALQRMKDNWKNRFKLVDAATDLPTFAAFEAITAAGECLIVGKIHRLEDLKRSLSPDLYREYIGSIVERLRLHASEQQFYIGQGHFLAWSIEECDTRLIQEHLEGLRALLSAPLLVGRQYLDVSITFGFDTNHSMGTAKRLAAATAAADRSTETYQPVVSTEDMSEEDVLWNASLQARIDAALNNKEIYLVYQPKILISTGDVIGVEALVRWHDRDKGYIPPDVFIRHCESLGRMRHLTKYTLREACEAWNALRDCNVPVPVAVNVSATLLFDRALASDLREILQETSLPPSYLTLEITETYRINDLKVARAVLDEIVALGVKISMDDFGVGAASFEAFMALPFDELKIDRMFVSQIIADMKARAIVRNAIRLGQDLRLIVVAEGVEDESTLRMLKDLGCVIAQGFGISKPLPIQQAIEFVRIKGESQHVA